MVWILGMFKLVWILNMYIYIYIYMHVCFWVGCVLQNFFKLIWELTLFGSIDQQPHFYEGCLKSFWLLLETHHIWIYFNWKLCTQFYEGFAVCHICFIMYSLMGRSIPFVLHDRLQECICVRFYIDYYKQNLIVLNNSCKSRLPNWR